MRHLKLDSNIEWREWGQVDPLWAVASWDGKKNNERERWTDEEFYKLGESDWKDFLTHWEKYGVNRKSCLEIGCGAGRITMHIAQNFQIVHAVDVSSGMIDYAKKHIKDNSVTFHVTEGIEIPLPDNSIDAVFSTHVFQHFDSLNVASAYFAEIFRLMTPGASLMIHLPIYKWPSTPKTFDYLYQIINRLKGIKVWVKRRLMLRGLSNPVMRSISYPIDYLYKTLLKLGFSDVKIEILTIHSNNSLHPVLLARKSVN